MPLMIGVVALYTSAWIEMKRLSAHPANHLVALYTSAWIEIALSIRDIQMPRVALYTSAWIEIYRQKERPGDPESHSTRVRGLK